MGENMVKGAKGVKVKILFQVLHITCVTFVLVIILKFVFQILPLTLHFRYKYKIIFFQKGKQFGQKQTNGQFLNPLVVHCLSSIASHCATPENVGDWKKYVITQKNV